jgi:prolyl-tRNA synthetase
MPADAGAEAAAASFRQEEIVVVNRFVATAAAVASAAAVVAAVVVVGVDCEFDDKVLRCGFAEGHSHRVTHREAQTGRLSRACVDWRTPFKHSFFLKKMGEDNYDETL